MKSYFREFCSLSILAWHHVFAVDSTTITLSEFVSATGLVQVAYTSTVTAATTIPTIPHEALESTSASTSTGDIATTIMVISEPQSLVESTLSGPWSAVSTTIPSSMPVSLVLVDVTSSSSLLKTTASSSSSKVHYSLDGGLSDTSSVQSSQGHQRVSVSLARSIGTGSVVMSLLFML